MTPLIEASDVVVTINGRTIVDRVTLAVAPGEIVALVGPNGAGKSTFLRTLSGEIRPTAGTVAIGGKPIHILPAPELAQRRAMLSQHTTVTFPFTVSEIVRMGAHPSGQRKQLETADDQFRPGLLLLDEPTSSLDLKHQLALLDTVRRFTAAGNAAIVVIHDLNLASMIANRLLMLRNGTLFASGSPKDVIDDATLQQVFGVANATGVIPSGDLPFVLPHAGRII
jgi:iron complex transport system ATP-binding protein